MADKLAGKLNREQVALSTIVSEALMAKAADVKCIADRADLIVAYMMREPDVMLKALGMAVLEHPETRESMAQWAGEGRPPLWRSKF